MKRTRKKHRLLFPASGCVLSLALCIGCFVSANVLEEETYQKYISISDATAKQVKMDTYQQAIQLCPDRPEAYTLLLDTFGEDGVFDTTESDTFLSIYNSNHSQLPDNEASGSMYAQAGLLYINGYEKIATVSMRMALPFFEAAAPLLPKDHPYYNATNCYVRIGQYYRDYIWTAAPKEVSQERMEAMLTDIEKTLITLTGSRDADKAFNYLGFSSAVCNLLYDQRDILAVTVDKQTVFNVLGKVYAGIPDPQKLQSVRTKEMALTLNANKEMYYDMISRAFDRNGGM